MRDKIFPSGGGDDQAAAAYAAAPAWSFTEPTRYPTFLPE